MTATLHLKDDKPETLEAEECKRKASIQAVMRKVGPAIAGGGDTDDDIPADLHLAARHHELDELSTDMLAALAKALGQGDVASGLSALAVEQSRPLAGRDQVCRRRPEHGRHRGA